MAHIVLVPGAFHGRRCWSRLIPLLETAGHRVTAPELLGMGGDGTPLSEISLSIWADQIAAVLADIDEPVVLVGHSRGGALISEVAERVPQRVQLLIYLAAFILPSGKSVFDLAATGSNAAAITAAFREAGGGMLSVSVDSADALFYNEVSEDWLVIAHESLGLEPLSALATPIKVTSSRFGTVPRAYIECTLDRAIPIELQRAMLVNMPCQQVVTLACDHSPFLSDPHALVEAIHSLQP
ncbi:alpha/beta fold hydrolase [Rhizobium sp. WYJ-E13]|uniref:alpha/beta fold hydrolase n=1 Tax=Rhizobium sp. WYJ-E13 TaxID=2849093 RepID=UPI001C1EF29F|nr:alpha/beta fold hydrolase [Rhizobium sp. WYJ-E13]QWW72451.1 alpha/beta fold hydrolase [Rhizobium sp. WYJ-E13]